MQDKDRLITDREVAIIYGISQSTVWKWAVRTGPDGRPLIPRPVVTRHKYTRWSENETQSEIERMKATEAKEAV